MIAPPPRDIERIMIAGGGNIGLMGIIADAELARYNVRVNTIAPAAATRPSPRTGRVGMPSSVVPLAVTMSSPTLVAR